MTELGLNAPQLAAKAGVHPGTVRALVSGKRWPHDATRDAIIAALGWAPGEISRRVWGGRIALEDVPTGDLIRELCRRYGEDHPHVREMHDAST